MTAPSPAGSTADILRARARVLARVAPFHAPASSRLALVEFRLARERYAVEQRFVREVSPLKALTPVPCTPPFVLGVIQMRGTIVPVLDFRIFFDLPVRELSELQRVIIVHHADVQFGLLTDGDIGNSIVDSESLQPSLPTLAGIRADYLKGVTGDRLAVLDLERILTDPGLIVHDEVDG